MADDRPLVELAPEAAHGRRRGAPRALETSDVTRFRGLLPAAAVGAVVAAALAIWSSGLPGLRSPGGQSRPHRLAKLECGSCHTDEGKPQEACRRCHGGLPSERPAHQELRRRGELGCTSCHAIHRADEGVAFTPDGAVIRYGTGWERELSGEHTLFRPTKTVSVPLVPARACAKCHDLGRQDDPIRECLIEGQRSPERPTVCFDEHRAVSGLAGVGAKVAPGATTERDAAWEAAREVASRGAAPALAGVAGSPVGIVGSGFGAALLVFGGLRLRARRRSARLEQARRQLSVVQPAAVRRVPHVDVATCLGCYACVDACPYDVLEVRRYVAVVARPDDCCGLTLCEQRCPNGSLVVSDGDPIDDRPKVKDTLESVDVPGLYLAGDLTGLPLIRNAINQGSHAVREIAERQGRARDRDGDLDLIVVGAGPAGISAALEAKARGLTAKLLEQATVAASIQSFPRGKLVFDQPLGMPMVGDLWLEESTKEELLAKWLRIVRRAELDIDEGRRVTRVERHGEAFVVTALGEEGGERVYRARNVLLAIGRRGSPRRLDVPIAQAAESRVFYALVDARAFAGQRVVVVGLGDTAMETAIALARQPATRVTLVYRGSGFRRGKARNIDEVKRLVGQGRVQLAFDSTVARVEPDHVVLRTTAGEERVDADAVFVLIGSILPWEFLGAVGVRRGAASAG